MTDSRFKGMRLTLEETVAARLYAGSSRYFCAEDGDAAMEDCRRHARQALAALGLDDLDAAVERVRVACATGFYQTPGELLPYTDKAQQIIAALLATQPTQSPESFSSDEAKQRESENTDG